MSGRRQWPNRDPLDELGFDIVANPEIVAGDQPGNGYWFVGNEPIANIDIFGLTSIAAQIGIAIMKGDVEALAYLLGSGELTASQAARVAAALEKFNTIAVRWIGKNCKGSIAAEFPYQYYNMTLGMIRQLGQQGDKAAQTAWKLLNKKEYRK